MEDDGSAATAAHDSADLLDSIEATLASAEPMSAEDDLILRMNAVSKVKASKKGGKKERAQNRSGPSKSIVKRQRAKRDTTKKMDSS